MISRTTLPLALVAVLSLGVSACDSPFSPAQAQSPQSVAQEDLLLQILDRLESLEARLDGPDSRTAMASNRSGGEGVPAGIDSLHVLTEEILGRTMTLEATTNSLVAQVGDLDALSDSIMELSSYVASETAFPLAVEVCGDLGVAAQAELSAQTHAEAEGEGGVGVKPWDTGAQAKASLRQRVKVDFKGAGELGLGLEGCLDLLSIGSDPPVRTASGVAVMASMSTAGLQAKLEGIQSQLGLDINSLEVALTTGTGFFQSGDVRELAALPKILPVPSALSDPLTLMRDRMSTFNAYDLLCGGTVFENRLQSVVNEGCGFIGRKELPSLGDYLNLGGDFASLDSSFDTLCGRFNQVVTKRLVVSDNLPWTDGSALDVQLFPSFWQVACNA